MLSGTGKDYDDRVSEEFELPRSALQGNTRLQAGIRLVVLHRNADRVRVVGSFSSSCWAALTRL